MTHHPATLSIRGKTNQEVMGLHHAGLGLPDVYTAALFAHTAKLNAIKKSEAKETLHKDVYQREALARKIKMVSINPSVYGNKFSVLGNS